MPKEHLTKNDPEDWLVAIYLASRNQGIESLAVNLDQPKDEVRRMIAEGGRIERERSNGYGGSS